MAMQTSMEPRRPDPWTVETVHPNRGDKVKTLFEPLGPGGMFPSIADNIEVDDCWEYIGHHNAAGYGTVNSPKFNSTLAHRIVYELLVGEIPEGMTLDHLCRNRACVNPDHLEVTTLVENMKRGAGFSGNLYNNVTHCKRGHQNWYVGARNKYCRTCKNDKQRQSYERKAHH